MLKRDLTPATLEATELFHADDAEITTFLDSLAQRSGSVLAYHYPFYRSMLEELGIGRPVYLGARRDGTLCGYLPAFLKESASGSVLCSLPFFGPNAGVLCYEEDRHEIHAVLLQELFRVAKDASALTCSLYTPFLFNDFAIYSASFTDALVVDKFTQYLDLSIARWSNEIERDLRRASKASIQVSCELNDDRLAAFYEIYSQNCADYGIPRKPWECIQFLAGDNIVGKFSRFYFAMVGEKLIAGLLVLVSPITASYYLPATRKEYRSDQPGTLLIDQAVREARSRGVKYWNWESSPSRDSGVYRFKQRWGASEANYRVYVQAFQSQEKLKELGHDAIVRNFPYYFVWPFDRL